MLFFSRDLLENIGAFVRFRQKKVPDVKIKQFFLYILKDSVIAVDH